MRYHSVRSLIATHHADNVDYRVIEGPGTQRREDPCKEWALHRRPAAALTVPARSTGESRSPRWTSVKVET